MRALDRKLWRDLRRIWAQSIAIALVLACGIMVLVLAQGAQQSLLDTRDAYYDRNRFADVFAQATRAPRSLMPEILAIPGVAQAEARIVLGALADLPGMAEPATLRVLSLPADGQPRLNVPLVRAGHLPDPARPDEVALSEPFAEANGLRPGDRFHVILNGQRRELTVAARVLSPEFVFTMGPGGLMPDDRRAGVLWMGEAAAAARDMDGAFNDVTLRLTRDGNAPAVIAALDALLDPYGGTGAQDRDRQSSHAFLNSELQQLGAMALILPPIFLIVSAFLVNMVLGRLIALERPQIGLLKAVGYTTPAIALHDFQMSIGIGILGVALGWGMGSWFGHLVTGMYQDFFRLPVLIYRPGIGPYLLSGALGLATVTLGALRAVWTTVRLPPAGAMLPPAPPAFRKGLSDQIGRVLRLRQTGLMILRSITRWPLRAGITVFGVAASIAVLVASFFTFDAMDQMTDELFTLSNRQHVTLTLSEATLTDRAVADAHGLPGVRRAEASYVIPVRLHSAHRTRLVGMTAPPDDAMLTQLLDSDGTIIRLPETGLALPEGLADALALSRGDAVRIDLLTGTRETIETRVTAIFRQGLGEMAYMSPDALFPLLRTAPQANTLNLMIDPTTLPALKDRVKSTPAIAGLVNWIEVLATFRDTIRQNILTMAAIYTILGMLITIGVVYNAARIMLSERAHELASLRVLGFTRAEVSGVLIGELMVLTLAGVPVGMLAGYGVAALMVRGFSTDVVSLPLVIERSTYASAALVVTLTALAVAFIVRRRLDGTDLSSALKRRE